VVRKSQTPEWVVRIKRDALGVAEEERDVSLTDGTRRESLLSTRGSRMRRQVEGSRTARPAIRDGQGQKEGEVK
jgi:hypothetical protein